MKNIVSKINLKKYLSFEYPRFLLAGIILLGLALRLKNLLSPILDLYPIRQEYCAMVARNFYRYGLNIFNPQVDWLGNLNSYWSTELPLVSFIAALLYKIFGIHEYLGRLVAVVFSIGSIYFLYRLVRLYFDEKTALFSTFCFAVLPLNVYFSRTFMPESLMIFFSIASVYLFSLWVENNKFLFFLAAVFFTALAFLAKVSALFICLPILFLFYVKYEKRLFLNWKIWFCFIAVALPVVFWYSRSNIKMTSYMFNSSENLKKLADPYFYKRLFESVSFFILTPCGIILFFLGFFIKAKDKRQVLFYVWFISVVLYIFLFPLANSRHYYYQLPLVPVCSVFMGRSLSFIIDKDLARASIFYKLLNTKILITILLVLILLSSILLIVPFYKWNHSTYEAAYLINKLTERDAIIIAGRCTQEAPLYYCDRKGWVINEFGGLSYVYNWAHKDPTLSNFPRLEEVDLVKYLIKKGARYYLAANLGAFNSNPRLVKFMRDNFKVWRETDKYVIFSLK